MSTMRRATASNVKPLIGLYSESGGGKTSGALKVAKGWAGDMSKVCMIETEAGRGEAWADDAQLGGYNVIPITEDFSPKIYGAKIMEAEKANIEVLIVDSGSHEWEGIGGVLSMAAKNLDDGKKGVQAWQKPKMDHKREFMLRLQQTRIPLVILCLRASYPMYEVTAAALEKWEKAGGIGKRPKVGDWARSWQLEPIQAEDVLFDMFVHGWLDRDEHKFHGTKYTLDVLRQVFIDKQPLTIETGQRLRQWSEGRRKPPTPASTTTQGTAADPAASEKTGPQENPDGQGDYITIDQCIDLTEKMREAKVDVSKFLARAKIEKLSLLPAKDSVGGSNYQNALKWIELQKSRPA